MLIAVLGPLEVRADDAAPIAVAGAKERLLLAVLTAATPDTVSVDRLAAVLWDDRPPVTARKSLQAHVVRLRSALEPDRPHGSSGRYIVRRGSGYALTVDRNELDVLAFGDMTSRGRAMLTAGEVSEAERLLSAALGLWRGEPYGDWPDASFAEADRHRLAELRSAALTGLLEARLALGRHADTVPELRRLVTEEPLHEEWWALLMLALYRAGRQSESLEAGRHARALLAEELGTDPGPGLRAMEAAILAQDPALEAAGPRPSSPQASAVSAEGTCPYKGLAAYQAADAGLFHGRARAVSGLVARLVDRQLIVVSGPSGAGKSSVVRAGLVPALAAGALPGSEGWRPLVLAPGPRPVDLLADLTGEAPPDAPVLLVCDQFEQLWRPELDAAERSAFLGALLGLLDDGIVTRCVVVVRGDHVGRLAEHAAFAERLAGSIVLVLPLTDTELRDVVREPARSVGLTVESELVDAVVADGLGRSGALPLLSTALVGTWERRRDGVLTLAGYLDAGGIAGALTRAAEETYTGLGEEARHLARGLLARLADTEDGGAFARRSVPLEELDAGRQAGARRAVVDAFVARRLLTVDGDRVEVAHESLFTAWPRLAAWLAEDSAGRAVRRHLAPAARDWETRGRPEEELYRGARLAAALDWVSEPHADPTPLEREFLEASQQRTEAEFLAVQQQVARERRARGRARLLAAGLAAVLVVALVATALAVGFQRAADRRAVEAERLSLGANANRLAAVANTVSPLDVSLLLAVQALRLADTPETEDGMLRSLLAHQRALGVVTTAEPVRDGTLGGGGTLFMDDGSALSAWSVTTAAGRREPPRRIGTWSGWLVADAAPAEDLLVAAGTDIYDQLWVRLLTTAGDTRSLVENGEAGSRPFGISFTGDGRRIDLFVTTGAGPGTRSWAVRELDLAGGPLRNTGISGLLPANASSPDADVGDDGRTAVVFDRADPAVPPTLVDLVDGHQVPLQLPTRGSSSIGFRAVGSGAAQMWSDGAVTLYGADGRPVQQVDHGHEPVLDVALSPDGTWAATVGGDGLVTLWDVDATTARWSLRESFIGHAGDIRMAEITRDGRELVTVGADERLVAWDATPGAGFGTAVAAQRDSWVAGPPEVVKPGLVVAPTLDVSADDEQRAPQATRIALAFLDQGSGRVIDRVDMGTIHAGDAPSMAVSPDRRRVAITTGFTTTVLDTRTRRPLGKPFSLPPDLGVGVDNRPRAAAFVSCLAWTPDSSSLVLCVRGNSTVRPETTLVIADPVDGHVAQRKSAAQVEAVATAPDGRMLAATSLADAVVLVLDPRTLDQQAVVSVGQTDATTDISFSPDGRRLAVTGRSGFLYVVDTTTLTSTRERIGSVAGLLQAEWLEDGRTVAVAGSDGTVSLFDADRGRLRVPPLSASNGERPTHVYVLPGTSDGLVAVSDNGPGRRWPLDPRIWIKQACTVVARDLTRDEWLQYLPGRPYGATCTGID